MTQSLDYSPEDFEQILQETAKIIQKQYENLEFLKGFNSVAQPEVAAWFDEPLPLLGMDYRHLLAETKQKVMDTATGNLGHNMYAYVMSGGNQMSTIAELLMSTVNQNSGKWHLSPSMTEIEQRVVKWAAEMIHFTPDAGGAMVDGRVFITGTKLNGEFVLRACLINHRKQAASVDYLLETIRNVASTFI